MAEQKVFAGPRIRRLRQEKGLTQTAMAEALGISPSYLNLIERNQRPLTVQLLLKLAALYQIDLAAFQEGDSAVIAALREAFRDPLISAELPGDRELVDFAEGTPDAAGAFVKLYRAYRESQMRLTDLTDILAKQGHDAKLPAGARLPVDELRDVMERTPFHFATIEGEAGAFLALLKPEDDLRGTLIAWLEAEHSIQVRVMPSDVMPIWRKRYERHSQRLFLSDRLSRPDQTREIAMEAAMLRMSVVIGASVEKLKLSSDEAKRIARYELGRYAAHALMMPLKRFRETALRCRFDIDVIAARFNVSFEQAAHRLVSVGGPAAPKDLGPFPIFFLAETDHAGNNLQRRGAAGFPLTRFGGRCPKLSIHAAFGQVGQIMSEIVEMPEGTQFLTIARTLDGPRVGYKDRPRRTALMLGCENHKTAESPLHQIIYADGLIGDQAERPPLECGPACRLCERQGCIARAEPPISRPLGLDEQVAGFSSFDYV